MKTQLALLLPVVAALACGALAWNQRQQESTATGTTIPVSPETDANPLPDLGQFFTHDWYEPPPPDPRRPGDRKTLLRSGSFSPENCTQPNCLNCQIAAVWKRAL